MAELGAPAPSEAAAAAAVAPQAATGDDGIRIHPHVFSFPEKRAAAPDFKRQLLRRLKPEAPDKSTRARVEQLAADLQGARAALLQELSSPPVSDVADSVTRKFEGYVGLLVALASPPAAAGSEQGQPGSSPAAAPASLRPSKLRDAVTFEWQDALFAPQAASAADAVFELASVAVAVAGWRLRRAAHLCRDSRAGVDSAGAAQAYRLVLLAAGAFQFVQEACGPLLARGCPSADCSPQAAGAAAQLCLAEAQAVTTLRAMAKSNAPSLVAALAVDAAALYRGAAAAAAAAGAGGGKLAAAAAWKGAAFQAYACCFQGLALLAQADVQAGAAVRLLEEAKRLAAAAVPLAAAFNRAEPATPAATHAEFDRDLAICVEAAAARAKRENEAVYFQRPPAELPPLPPGRRLAAPLLLALPPPPPALRELLALDAFAAVPVDSPPVAPAGAAAAAAPAASGAPAAAAGGPKPEEPEPEAAGGASCCRWLLVVIAMPVLAILSVVGALVWLVLLPVKIICCPIGCLVQLMADLVEYLLKAPFRAMLWASGKPWKASNAVDVEAGQQRR